MISTAFVYFAYYVLSLLFAVFPESSGFPEEVLTAINYIAGYTAIINTLVPMETVGTILGLVITFELAVFAFKGLRFVFGYVPFVGGRG